MIAALFRRLVLAPVVIALTTLMWTAIPFWLIGTSIAAKSTACTRVRRSPRSP